MKYSNTESTVTPTPAPDYILWWEELGRAKTYELKAKYMPASKGLHPDDIKSIYYWEHPSTTIPEQANAKWYLIPTSFKPIGELREVIIAEMEVTADLTEGREFDSPTSIFLRGENDRLKMENEALKERVKELEKQVNPKIYY